MVNFLKAGRRWSSPFLPVIPPPRPPFLRTSSSAKATASSTIFLPSVGDWQAKVMCTTPLTVFCGSWVRSR